MLVIHFQAGNDIAVKSVQHPGARRSTSSVAEKEHRTDLSMRFTPRQFTSAEFQGRHLTPLQGSDGLLYHPAPCIQKLKRYAAACVLSTNPFPG